MEGVDLGSARRGWVIGGALAGQEANPGPGLSAARYDPAGTSGEQYRPKDARHLHIWPCRICSQ